MICVVKLCYAPRQTHILMTCTCNCSMHIQHNVMQLSHANSAPACTRSRSPHNVLHSPSYLIGASLSEPHIDEFAVNFLSIYTRGNRTPGSRDATSCNSLGGHSLCDNETSKVEESARAMVAEGKTKALTTQLPR